MAKVIRTWAFFVSQIAFVAGWFGAHHFFPYQLPFDVLQVLLLTEGCCIGSVFLMNHQRHIMLDRRIALNDYIVDCQMRTDVKDLKPLIQALHKDMRDKKDNKFWCEGCGEPRYKCCCEEEKRLHTS